MNQFNQPQSMAKEFSNSCLGKIIILAIIAIILSVVAIISAPNEEMMVAETEDNVHQCLQDNDNIKGDIVDEVVANIGRTVTVADSTLDNKEALEACKKHNKIEAYRHSLYSTARIRNNAHPEGVRVGIGIFGFVISTICYEDLVMNISPVRGKYNEPLIKESTIPDPYIGENPHVEPYHYEGNPDN